jgi:hypothetical protein
MRYDNEEALLRWHVKSLDGKHHYVEAYTAEEAAAAAGLKLNQCAKWFPFPIKVVPTAAQRERQQEVFQQLKKLTHERRLLRQGPKSAKVKTPEHAGQQPPQPYGGNVATVKKEKEKEKKVTIRETAHEALKKHGDDYEAVNKVVKAAFPKSKFNEGHMRWYMHQFGMTKEKKRAVKANVKAKRTRVKTRTAA